MLRLKNVAGLVVLLGCSGTTSMEPVDNDDSNDETEEDSDNDEGNDEDSGEEEEDTDEPGEEGPDEDASVEEDERDASVPPVDPCPLGSDAIVDVTAATVTAPDGAAPRKGDPVTVTLTVANSGTQGAEMDLTVLIDSMRFDDFVNVPLASTRAKVCPGENTVTLVGGPFLSSGSLQFAMGSGDYQLNGVVLKSEAGEVTDSELSGKAFALASTNALLVPVLYNQGYFDEIEGDFESPEAYLTQAFTRRSEIFTPSTNDPDGPGDFMVFEGGYDEMMNVRHVFKSFIGFDGTFDSGENWCYGAMDYASQVLGLKARWTGGGTRNDQHGFDYVIALSSNMGGGVAWSPFDVQVSGFINRDVDRQQVIAVHETAHVFGAPHCDDVGNGSGGALQGYVMCSGEKHERYPGSFVFHSTSLDHMSSRWN